jgi:hypothetical protein
MCSIAAHRAIAVAVDVTHNAADCRLDVCQVTRTALRQLGHKTSLLGAFENAHHAIAHHITTLFSGYSTMP